ncbi:uncharacterized protein [Ptychodera flava]|uniref:uncharacterized protein n=1 Tax=Ptychodera flava TaxID=63121 RepID=UPI00396A48EC
MEEDDIVIRPADKGSGIVIMDTDEYQKQVETELDNNTTYQRVNKDRSKITERKVNNLVEKMYRNGHIDKETRNYMKVKNTNPGKVKANPKMHKPGHPIRTIISGIGHATEPLAEFAEQELEENVTQLNSYIRDTPHFLWRVQEEVQQPLPEGAIIFCMDVRALYPSIPRKRA